MCFINESDNKFILIQKSKLEIQNKEDSGAKKNQNKKPTIKVLCGSNIFPE